METRTFECSKCHKRAKSSLKMVMPCPNCRLMMQNVTGKPVYTFECSRCGKRKRTSFAYGISCEPCHTMMTKVN